MSRRIAFGIGAMLLLVATCQAPPPDRPAVEAPPRPQAHDVQVTAHPDDDLLFMNPDLAEGMRSGRPTTGIFLTGGEADAPDKAGYAAARQEGTRAAYARMLGAPNDWQRGTMPAGTGRVVEVNALRADPDVRLVFLNLPEDANPEQGRHALTRLRHDPSLTVTTTVPAGAAVAHPQPFDRRAVVDALTALLDAFQPTAVRLQDDQPDRRYQPNWVGSHNHPDHVAGAALAREAVAAHRPRAFSPMVLTYRDYNVADTPSGLSEQDKVTTREAFTAYAAHDVLAAGGVYRTWSDNSAYRWPRRSRWVSWTEGGAVQAFSVRAHGLARWSRTPAGTWNAPELLPLPEPLRPQVSLIGAGRVLVAQNQDGSRILLRRAENRWDVVDAPASSGPPAAAVDSGGRIVLAVKNTAGGVSLRRETAAGSGRWHPWTDLGGTDVQDGLSVVPGRDGAVHVVAATRATVLHWQVPNAGGANAEAVPIGTARPAGVPVAETARDGSLRLLVRTDRGGEIVERTWTPQGWREDRTTLPSPGGLGDPALVPHGPGGLIRITRDSAGRVHVADRPGGPWTDLGGSIADHPAAIGEPNGDITLVGTGFDGELLVNTATPGPGGLTFRGWRPAVTGPPAIAARPE